MLKLFQFLPLIIAGFISICNSDDKNAKILCSDENERSLCLKACPDIGSFYVETRFSKNHQPYSLPTKTTIGANGDNFRRDDYKCYTTLEKIFHEEDYNTNYNITIHYKCDRPNESFIANEKCSSYDGFRCDDREELIYDTHLTKIEKPDDISATWLESTDQLNVSWRNPRNERCKFYDQITNTVSLKLTFSTVGDQLLPATKLIQDNKQWEHFLIMNVPARKSSKLITMGMCVQAKANNLISECNYNTSIIKPPVPIKFDMGKISVKKSLSYKILVIQKLSNIDDFLSTIYIYAYKELNFLKLKEIERDIANRTVPSAGFILQEDDTTGIRDKSNNDWKVVIPHELLKHPNMTVIVFTVNELNGYLTISNSTPTGYGERNHSTLALIATIEYSSLPHYKVGQTNKISNDDFANYLKNSLENGHLLSQFQKLPKYEKLTCHEGTLPKNQKKNRYRNVIAFDHTLVTLATPVDRPNIYPISTYINANYVKGYDSSSSYIATQGPLPHTITDFWSMIWENKVENIVMVTNLCEGSKKQCEQYWPNPNDNLKFHKIRVWLISSESYPTYDVRIMGVRLDGVTRTVTQRHFNAWPPSGNVLYSRTLVPFVTSILQLPSNAPILVHCSAGIGRTGVIILCDIMLRMMAAEGAVDFCGCVKRLRRERPNLVANFDLYKLAHLIVLAASTAMDTRISGDMDKAIKKILLERNVTKQFEYIKKCEWQDDAMKPEEYPLKVPILFEKNRFPHLLPDRTCQVYLNQLPNSTSSSRYINAIDIGGIIVTQHPLTNTMSDFWRMVSEQNCNVIINLNLPKSQEIFWPTVNHSMMKLENGLTLNHIEEEKIGILDYRLVQIEHQVNNFEVINFKVGILSFTGWSSTTPLPDSIHGLVDFAMSTESLITADNGTVITCFDGATASGIYIALVQIYEQIQRQNECDVCQTVKELKTYRKEFIEQEEQLELLYKAVLASLPILRRRCTKKTEALLT